MEAALVWFPHNPHPPSSGAHQRCLAMLEGLKQLGYCTTLLSSELTLDGWDSMSVAALKQTFVDDIRLYQPDRWDWYLLRATSRLRAARTRLGGSEHALHTWMRTPPRYRRWSRRQAFDVNPTVMLSSYALYDPLVPHDDFRSIPRVIDSIDLVTGSNWMWSRLHSSFSAFAPLRTEDVPGHVLTNDFLADVAAHVAAEEFATYDKYNVTMAISPLEADVIRSHTSSTTVHHVPMTAQVTHGLRSHSGPALFVGGPNPFNLQGLLWFARHVMPLVLRSAPDFVLDVVGTLYVDWFPPPRVRLHGYVAHLEGFYERAAFTICPLLAGTGQQVKVVHSLANGLPVVSTPLPGASGAVDHAVDGFVASSPEEFAAAVTALWVDRKLCHQLGSAGREKVAREYSPERLQHHLAVMLRR